MKVNTYTEYCINGKHGFIAWGLNWSWHYSFTVVLNQKPSSIFKREISICVLHCRMLCLYLNAPVATWGPLSQVSCEDLPPPASLRHSPACSALSSLTAPSSAASTPHSNYWEHTDMRWRFMLPSRLSQDVGELCVPAIWLQIIWWTLNNIHLLMSLCILGQSDLL